MKAFVVLNEYRKPMEYAQNPWLEGKPCLVDGDGATIFKDRKSAQNALDMSKKYAREDDDPELAKVWNIDKWEIVSLTFDSDDVRL